MYWRTVTLIHISWGSRRNAGSRRIGYFLALRNQNLNGAFSRAKSKKVVPQLCAKDVQKCFCGTRFFDFARGKAPLRPESAKSSIDRNIFGGIKIRRRDGYSKCFGNHSTQALKDPSFPALTLGSLKFPRTAKPFKELAMVPGRKFTAAQDLIRLRLCIKTKQMVGRATVEAQMDEIDVEWQAIWRTSSCPGNASVPTSNQGATDLQSSIWWLRIQPSALSAVITLSITGRVCSVP
ncbi:hypothetical protein B0H16DRAFT_1798319 [Mycena metata]|uniref:Uncharacterized protein n=1 Tax=Mycena metata TaxID=1033252 RepID=A0AAD7NKS9_9AGAR|nr:hypothetical protein B0H16DRAFT_1798319 [Mycena metata]